MRLESNLYSSSMLELVDNIVEVVVNSYFYWVEDYQLKEDLMQEGYLKAYELLKTGNYDPNQSLRNYLYTGVRNAMTNYNYHAKKEKHSSYDVFCDNVECDKEPDSIVTPSQDIVIKYEMDCDMVQKCCDKYNKNYIGNIIKYFENIGVYIDGTGKEGMIVSSPNDLIIKAIVVDCLWNI